MRVNRSSTALAVVALSLSPLVASIALNMDDTASTLDVTATYAHEMMTYYKNNVTGTPADEVGVFPKPPYYWWESGAVWGGLVDYWAYTNDSSYVNTTREGLIANFGPANDLIMPNKRDQEGNDDQAFWIFALMSALEYQFPTPSPSQPQYLDVAVRAFDGMAARWDLKTCNGGLKWQIYPDSNVGYDYKNSVSNGAFFAVAARLARYTGNNTYMDWAVKTWDWCQEIGLIGDSYEIFDGTDDTKNCSEISHMQWSYGVGIFMHGAATMYNYTNGSAIWEKRTSGLLARSSVFFSPFKNSTDIMWEAACEGGQTCDTDQQSFKAYLARFLGKTTIMAPYTAPAISTLLRTSATAAAVSCSGGSKGVSCGSKWYVGGHDGTYGLGQQLSALEVTQALLVAKAGAPDTQADVHIQAVSPTTTAKVPVKTTTIATVATHKPTNAACKYPGGGLSSVLGGAALGAAVAVVW